jgi:uncharacterized repeat protein (TIGR02543 family)/prepilin-type N-terminal cleavage/methylation domain-containing protein
MTRRIGTDKIKFRSSDKKHHGFTLVELIVVLVILAILATAGVALAVWYIRRSKIDKNNQNAITVYQTAQVALTKKSANGTLTDWIKEIPGLDVETDEDLNLSGDTITNYSCHKIVALTYNHNTQDGIVDKYLYDFLSSSFYDLSIFNSTITIEFDICKTKDNGFFSYTANVVSVFYSAENDSQGGWDSTRLKNSPDGVLPSRNDTDREETLVGYYCGPDNSSAPGNISSVMIPWDPTYELEGHVIGPTADGKRAAGYLFNLRNAETLDVSWAFFDEDRDEEREGEQGYNYYYEARDDHAEKLHILLEDIDDDSIKTHLYITNTNFETAREAVDGDHPYKTYETVEGKNIERTTWYGFITVKVRRNGDTNTVDMKFPFAKTLVKGDTRTGCPADITEGYYEYSITLDAMMSRGSGADSDNSYATKYLGIGRLFKTRIPKNITATLCDTDTSWSYKDKNGTTKTKSISSTFAARSIDDPVYLIGTSSSADKITYLYSVREHSAVYDGEDDEVTYDDYVITGQAVVNTYFGDKVYSSVMGTGDTVNYIGGTDWTGSEKTAVLTNCRHLYNIRWMNYTDKICYRIVSDINWYVRGGNRYSSEVKVFKDNTSAFKSPVDDLGNLCVVAFPALNKLTGNSTLTSISNSDKRIIYSINGIQLRAGSFKNNTDGGYGLFCQNYGTIYNVYINNLSLTLASVEDGSYSDYAGTDSSFCPSGSVTIGSETGSFKNYPIGALVGHNFGLIGSDNSELSESVNTVRVSNSIVMGGSYWKYYSACSDVGGIIGKNSGNSGTSSTYGLIKVAGRFVVLGFKNAGGIIGYNCSDISARLEVDGNATGYGSSDFTIPTLAATNSQPSCAVISDNRAGGAIGQTAETHKFTRSVGTGYSISEVDSSTGEIEFSSVSKDKFHIYVTLPENSLILHTSSNSDPCAGGAIGFLNASNGDNLYIYTQIAGSVISTSGNDAYCGGAIGREKDCAIKNIYLECNNSSTSLIGLLGTSTTKGATAAGGAYGRILSTNTDRTIAVNVVNAGTISSRGSDNGLGSGGAIGGTVDYLVVPLKIRVVNEEGSNINGYGSSNAKAVGTGGAIGGLSGDNAYLPAGTTIYVENSGSIFGNYNVGGAIGFTSKNYGSIYTVNYNTCTISGNSFIGGAIGRNAKSQSGIIQAVLKGATIDGIHFVGGAAGRLLYLQDNAEIRTVVKSDSTVHGDGYYVGGVCGDVLISGAYTDAEIELKGDSTNPVLTVKSGDEDVTSVGTGGVAGIFRSLTADTATITLPTQTDLNKLALYVEGQDSVGGVFGKYACSNSTSVTPTDFSEASNSYDINLELTVYLNPQSHVKGSGENVGGAIGYIHTTGSTSKFTGKINVISIYGSSDGQSYIQGGKNVGGAVGKMMAAMPYADTSSGITVNFTRSKWKVISTVTDSDQNSNAGGAVGYLYSYKNTNTLSSSFEIDALLGSSEISGSRPNVGGAIGYNECSLKQVELTVHLDVKGSVSGTSNVGGVIGKNSLIQDYGYIELVDATINGKVTGTGDNVGGAIGYNYASINKTIAVINGTVESDGDYVGGAIGLNDSTHKNYLLTYVDSSIQGSGSVNGNDSVGGAIGKNIGNISTIKAAISGNAKVNGQNCVGGALGFASSATGQTGGNILKLNDDKCFGRILNIYINISADYALSGKTRMGGAVGQVGAKVDGTNYNSACLVYVEATLNSAYLFDPEKAGTSDGSEACLGGIVGIFVDGRLGVSSTNPTNTGKVVLKGTGGVVNTANYISEEYFPARTYGNTVFIGASGSSIGGMIGQIGLSGYQQNVCLSNLSVDANGPDLCVVSLNGKDRIGGWIGSGYAAHGGIGNEKKGTNVTYNVSNVKAVISIDANGKGGSEIGGFCGRIDGRNNNQISNDDHGTFAQINVNLTDANIIGGSRVGGVFGEACRLDLRSGGIKITLNSYTNIGDVVGNSYPGDPNNLNYKPVCYEAGGVIGYIEEKNKYDTFSVPVYVVIDSTSRIAAMGAPDKNAADYGVGGVFGTVNDLNLAGTNMSFRVISEDGVKASIFSASTNVGGIAGLINSGVLKNASVIATINSKAQGVIGVGGVVGKIKTTDKMFDCHFGDDAWLNGNDGFKSDAYFGKNAVYNPGDYHIVAEDASLVGGYAGTIEAAVQLSNCYTTATVDAGTGAAVGGFIGAASSGSISNCYSSGRTYNGNYIYGSGNIIGGGYTGGFVGQTNGGVTFTDCYSTSSVLGAGTYAGGFIGYSSGKNSSISSCYCTGRVTVASDASTVAGAFAGYTTDTTFSSAYALFGVNTCNLVGEFTGDISHISSVTASVIRGANTHTAHPFDTSLGTTFAYRAVKSNNVNEHWGDWPIVEDSDKTDIATLMQFISLSQDSFAYSKSNYHLENYLILEEAAAGLVFGTDFSLEYLNTDRAREDAVVVITGIGDNYTGAISLIFKIVEVDLETADNVEITLGSESFEYTGAPKVPTVSVKVGDDELVENIDYYLEYTPDNINIGPVAVTVVGMGNYKGNRAAGSFNIVGRNLDNAEVTLLNATEEELVYDGTEKKPGVIVRLDGKTLNPLTDYNVSYSDNIHAGEASIIISPKSVQYDNEKVVKFRITKATNRIEVEPAISGWIWNTTPSPLTHEFKAEFGVAQYSVYRDPDCKTDYVLGPYANTDLQSAMSVLDAGNYYLYAEVTNEGTYDDYDPVSAIVPFTVDRWNITNNVTVELEYASAAYSGNEIKPGVTVKYNGDETLDSANYSVSYGSDTISVGEKTITITGQNNCYGTVTATYTIKPVWTVTFDPASGTLDGESGNTLVEIVDGGTVDEPNDPVRDGYYFDGWYWNPNPSTSAKYDFDSKVTKEITIYAKWTKKWTVTFVWYEGKEEYQDHRDGEIMQDPGIPERTGYEFVGWFNESFTNEWTSFNVPVTMDYRIYAKWTPHNHTVNFETNCEATIPSVNYDYSAVIAKPTDPIWEGHVFDGWYSDSELNDPVFDGVDLLMPDEDITLYAKWHEEGSD